MIEDIIDEFVLDWIENNVWDYMTDRELVEFIELEGGEDMSIIWAIFAEHKGWA